MIYPSRLILSGWIVVARRHQDEARGRQVSIDAILIPVENAVEFELGFVALQTETNAHSTLKQNYTKLQVRTGTTTRTSTGNCWNSYEFHRWIQNS